MWILPSRGRPHNAARLFSAFVATGATTPGILCVDDDDPRLDEYRVISLPEGWALDVQERIGLGPMLNRAFEQHPEKHWYGDLSDDAMPITIGWDRALIEAAGSDGIAYCADGIRNEEQVNHFVIGGDLARELGWIILPGLVRIYGDNVLTDIGKARGVLRYLPNERLEHWHFSNGLAEYDETYRKPEAANDAAVYLKWKSSFSCTP